MSDWDNAKQNIKNTAKEVARKVDEFADKTSLYLKIQQAESNLDELYARLGRLAYRKMNDGEDVQEEISALMPSVTAKIREVDDLKARYDAVGKDNI